MTRVTKIEIRPSTLELQEGEYGLVEAYLEPANATYADIVWTTDNSNIATVNSGHIVAKKRGTTKVKAVSLCDVSVKGECTLTVIPPKRVQSISFPRDEYTIVLGRPDYIFPNFTPSDALNKDLTWCCYDENIISVTDGLVTPKAAGTTKLIAVSSDGSHTATCTVRVVIDDVIIKKNGGFVDVIFESTGKTWKCIGQDMIFNDANRANTMLIDRANYNLYLNPNKNEQGLIVEEYRDYSDEEFKLLFAIDPLGVARYVETFASQIYTGNLEAQLAYKDEFFRLVANRPPKYFKRLSNGEWEETTNTSDLENVISESESYFGMHPGVNGVRVAVSFVNFVASVIKTFVPDETVDLIVDVVSFAVKIQIFYAYEEYEEAANEIYEYILDNLYEIEDEVIENVFDVLGVFNSYLEMMDCLKCKPLYFCKTIDYCDTKVDYNVLLELADGNQYALSNINTDLKN